MRECAVRGRSGTRAQHAAVMTGQQRLLAPKCTRVNTAAKKKKKKKKKIIFFFFFLKIASGAQSHLLHEDVVDRRVSGSLVQGRGDVAVDGLPAEVRFLFFF